MTFGNAHSNRRALAPRRLAKSVKYALRGIVEAVRSEPNMRFHLLCSVLVLFGCLVVRPDIAKVTLALCTCAFVCVLELVNTAIEATIDLETDGNWHPLAGVAKDAAAGAVLMAAFLAVSVGIYLLVSTYPWRWRLFSGLHMSGAIESMAGLAGIALLRFMSWRLEPRNVERTKEETPK